MKKTILLLILTIALGTSMALAAEQAYNFGDMRSVTLATKAWEALDKGDIEAVLAYANKCVELYGAEAQKMQAALKDYVKGDADGGSNQDVFKQWALNDVSTCYFIQGEAYKKAKMDAEAKEAYQTVIDKYSFGQCWDPKGWFWKPAEAAKERLAALETGVAYDFGDYTSQTLTTKAWGALNANDLNAVVAYTTKCIDLYSKKAKDMQASLTKYPYEKDEIFKLWALNDVGTCYFILGSAYQKAGKIDEAKAAFKKIADEFSFAQCWDPQGWFWKPVDGAKEKLAELETMKK